MFTIKKYCYQTFCALLVFSPSIAIAAKECRVIEYPDHFEAVCVGDPNYAIKQREQAVSNTTPTNGAEASRKRQRIIDVRSLNTHRFDATETSLSPDTTEKKKQ